MSADVLLQRLECVQKQGTGWRARCPACGGKSRKLSVSEVDEGRVLLHCFGGCDAADVVQAAGLQLSDLFPERLAADTPDERRRRQRLARESQWGAAIDALAHESRVVAIVSREITRGQALTLDDYNRVLDALERIEAAQAILRDDPRSSREQGAKLPRRLVA